MTIVILIDFSIYAFCFLFLRFSLHLECIVFSRCALNVNLNDSSVDYSHMKIPSYHVNIVNN